MRRILCFIDELGSGGAERQLVGLAHLLKDKGYMVDVFCYHPIYFYEPYLKEHDINLIKVSSAPKKFYHKLISSFRVLHKGKYDLIISFSPGSSFASLLLKPFIHGSKVLVSDRNMTPVFSFKERVKFNLYRFADYIVPNSYTQTEILSVNFPFMRKKLHTITNFVDLNSFAPVEYTTKSVPLRIVVVARHAVDKNIPAFIEAVKLLKLRGCNFRIDWFGNYENALGKANIAKTKALGVDDIIHFWPPRHDVRTIYSTADALCLPSVREGFSNVIGEALCCGLPVLCGNISDNVRMIEDNVNGFLFDPNSPEDMANVIEKFSQCSEDTIKTMRNNNIKKAKAILDPQIFISKYVSLIEA